MRRWSLSSSLLPVLLGLVLLVACGGMSRRVLVEAPRDSYDSLFEGLIQVAAERGLEARSRRGGVSVAVDRETGARITYAPRRGGLYMSVGVRTDEEAEDAELALAEAELAELEALGQELLRAARERARGIDEARAAREREERELAARQRAEEDARRAANPAPDPFALRIDPFTPAGPSFGSGASSGGDSGFGGAGSSGGASGGAQCCINGAFYACPDAASIDRCAGAFTRCLAACDFSCMDACLSSNPPDPSSCTRTPARDGEC